VSQKKQGIYEFHDFQLDIGKGILLRDGEPVSMQWKTFELLCVLVESNGNLLTRDELMNELWADTFVEDNNLSQHIRALRKSLGENENGGGKLVETVAGRGYRFLPEVRIVDVESKNGFESHHGTSDQIAAGTISNKARSESLTIIQPKIAAYVSDNGNEEKTAASAAHETFIEIISKNAAAAEVTTDAQSAVKQATRNSSTITRRRAGLRRGLKFLLWGAGVGFGFLILFQILQISIVTLFANPNYPPTALRDMIESLLGLLLIPVLSGYFIGIGLFLFGIARMIYALFEKESSKLQSSSVERWTSIVVISLIAAVAIPNLIASYRTAKEFRQKQKQNPTKELPANNKSAQFLNFSSVKYQKVIENQHGRSAISPDGRFLVYTDIVSGKQTLWLRQLATKTNIQILPLNEADYYQLRFSNDSEYIYFNHNNALYRVAVLGGEAVLILKEVEVFSLSPDDKEFVFIRHLPDYQCGLFIAGTDGSAEREISRRQSPCYGTLAWSPDGKLIAYTVGQSDTGDANTQLFGYKIDDGSELPLSEERWFHIHSIAWLPEQSGIILSGRKKLGDENPLWQVNYPGGETRQLTDGLVRYVHLSLTADGKQLLASQSVLDSYLSIAPADAPSNFRKLGSAFFGMTWLPGGKIVYSSRINKNSLWTINADGTEHKQLTFDEADYLNPVASSDGRYIFYTSTGGGINHIWRMNKDGTGKLQLTNGSGEQKPNISSDGQWLFYQIPGKSPTTIWKVSTDGGEPIQITTDNGTNPSVSPDGKQLAYIHRKESNNDTLDILVMSLENGQIIREFVLPEDTFIGTHKILWTRDGQALIYTREKLDRIANIWIQPLDSSLPKQITNYNSERIFDFGWSPDGAQLAVIRGSWKNEAVLISGFR
jgi:Tol biopolymer transport system component/DNA-binding winged helix-turn-helix (wHTH) protein